MTLLHLPADPSWRTQFVISSSPPVRDGWDRRVEVGSTSAYLYPDCESVVLVDGMGTDCGLFIGSVYDLDERQTITGTLTVDLGPTGSDPGPAIERFAYRLGGSWLLLVTTAAGERLYLDSCGSRPAVYDTVTGTVASTTGLLMSDEEYQRRYNGDLYHRLGLTKLGWFPSGLTAHHDVHRVLPSHYLDLSRRQTVRHWPSTDFGPTPTSAAADEVCDLVERFGNVTLADGRLAQGLTGGADTRFLMAANRKLSHDITFITVEAGDSAKDLVLAARLAEIASVDHQVLPLVTASPDQQLRWQFRTGHCITGANMRAFPSLEPLRGYGALLGGVSGEVGRGFFWRSSDDDALKLDAESLLPRLGMPVEGETIEATRRWLEPIADLDPFTILDLAFLELRVGPWAFAQRYTSDIVPHAYPLVHRRIVELLISQPAEARRTGAYITEGIRQRWPELLSIPINRYGDHRDTLEKLAKFTDFNRVRTRIRKVFG